MRTLSSIRFGALLLVTSWIAAPAGAALSIYMTPEELADRSSHIVEATVRNVASGEDPTTGTLATYITLDVTRLLRGPASSPDVETLVVREWGGAIDGRVHAIDAVPTYRRGERVIAFLEPGPDGALHTTGMFFGKYVLESSSGASSGEGRATRDLDGRGAIVGRPGGTPESISTADLMALAARPTTSRSGPARVARERPAEFDRLRWADASKNSGRSTATGLEKFGALSLTNPTRWQEGAAGIALTFDVERARNPLGNGALAAEQIERALAAWTEVPESRVVIVPGNTDAAYTSAQPSSPAQVYPSSNIVLFGDPYGDISDPNPTYCSGVLAVGGYWRTDASAGTANGVTFNRALRGYVIFNNDFECFLGVPDNLAEVATHEIGHALGFGHSTENDSIMRASAHGLRGSRLGDDDRDAAHCHYPHTLTLDGGVGGGTVDAETVLPITWSATVEAGIDPGVVSVEASFDGGAWEPIAEDVTNDGYYGWFVPRRESTNVRVRVARPNRGTGGQSLYPSACSAAAPSTAFAIAVPARSAGSLPATLSLAKAAAGPESDVRLAWDASCSGDVDDHAVYSGDLQALRAGVWNLSPVTCSAGADLVEYVTPSAGDRYYLITPLAEGVEGSLGSGNGSGRAPRPRSAAACGIEETAPACQ